MKKDGKRPDVHISAKYYQSEIWDAYTSVRFLFESFKPFNSTDAVHTLNTYTIYIIRIHTCTYLVHRSFCSIFGMKIKLGNLILQINISCAIKSCSRTSVSSEPKSSGCIKYSCGIASHHAYCDGVSISKGKYWVRNWTLRFSTTSLSPVEYHIRGQSACQKGHGVGGRKGVWAEPFRFWRHTKSEFFGEFGPSFNSNF